MLARIAGDEQSLLSGPFLFEGAMKLQIADIDDHLDMVLPLLTDLCRRDCPEWTVEDALDACRCGLWLLVVGDKPGFAMFSVRQQRFTGLQQLYMEVACHPAGEHTVLEYQPFWNLVAFQLGCDEIVMSSKRKGWEKLGWQGGWIQYSRPVQEVQNGK